MSNNRFRGITRYDTEGKVGERWEYDRRDGSDGDQREFDLETRVTTNGNIIISKMLHSCALNK